MEDKTFSTITAIIATKMFDFAEKCEKEQKTQIFAFVIEELLTWHSQKKAGLNMKQQKFIADKMQLVLEAKFERMTKLLQTKSDEFDQIKKFILDHHSESKPTLHILVKVSALLAQKGEYERAIMIVSDLMEKYPSYIAAKDGFVALGLDLLDRGQKERALEIF